jgi:TRAP-type C4-dicarboxylate transport system substrate-binding protein
MRYNTQIALGLDTRQAMIMNLEAWKNLPQDIQQQLMSVSGRVGVELAGEGAYGTEVDAIFAETMIKAGKEVEKVNLDSGELEKWQTIAGKPLIDDWIAKMKTKGFNGQKVVDTLISVKKKYE